MPSAITPQFQAGDTVWFVNPSTLLAVSTTVIDTTITVSNTLVVTITYNTSYGYVKEPSCFATQTLLANSYLPVAP